jgi:FkbM family methyltransferase
MTVVVDLGCYPHQDIDSIAVLAEKYEPRLLLAFDPLSPAEVARHGHTLVITAPLAAWTRGGTVGFHADGIESAISETGETSVGCFDLADLLAAFDHEEVIVKMDVEGSEYPLLEHLQAANTDADLELLLVEWHGDDERRERITAGLRCPIEEWLL